MGTPNGARIHEMRPAPVSEGICERFSLQPALAGNKDGSMDLYVLGVEMMKIASYEGEQRKFQGMPG